MRNGLARVVDAPAFTATVVVVILANALVLGLQTYPRLEQEHGGTLDLLNALFLGFFGIELLLRIASYRRPLQFFREGWNVFDFIVIGIAFLPGFGNNATIFRLARLARIVRVVHLLPDVRILITGVIRSLPPLGSMAILTTLILFVYGMVGWQLFSEDLPEQWGNIGEAMLTLFVMLTLEDFPQYMEAGMEIHSWSWVFFVSRSSSSRRSSSSTSSSGSCSTRWRRRGSWSAGRWFAPTRWRRWRSGSRSCARRSTSSSASCTFATRSRAELGVPVAKTSQSWREVALTRIGVRHRDRPGRTRATDRAPNSLFKSP